MRLIKKLLIGGALLTATTLAGCATAKKAVEQPETYESRDPKAILYDHEAGMNVLKGKREKDAKENREEFQGALNKYEQETYNLAQKKIQDLEDLSRKVREYLESQKKQ